MAIEYYASVNSVVCLLCGIQRDTLPIRLSIGRVLPDGLMRSDCVVVHNCSGKVLAAVQNEVSADRLSIVDSGLLISCSQVVTADSFLDLSAGEDIGDLILEQTPGI